MESAEVGTRILNSVNLTVLSSPSTSWLRKVPAASWNRSNRDGFLMDDKSTGPQRLSLLHSIFQTNWPGALAGVLGQVHQNRLKLLVT
jgi:hypothetical protein